MPASASTVVSARHYMLWFGDYHSWPEVAGSTDPTGRRGPVRSAEAEQGLKRRHGLAPAIVTEDELVEVDGKLGAADAMVGANQPLIVESSAARIAWISWSEGCLRVVARGVGPMVLGSAAGGVAPPPRHPATPSVIVARRWGGESGRTGASFRRNRPRNHSVDITAWYNRSDTGPSKPRVAGSNPAGRAIFLKNSPPVPTAWAPGAKVQANKVTGALPRLAD